MQQLTVSRSFCLVIFLAIFAVLSPCAFASDWPRFRGPNGSGVNPDSEPTPTTWTDSENVKWDIDLPGPGSSCPIVVGDKVFVTCWSGYGLDRNEPGDQAALKRHLVCVNRQNGEVLWDQAVDPYLPEDEYGGMFAEHGYASHTPVSDGEYVFAFFGKTGVVAFDMDGKKLWQTSVGTESGIQNWGTASSPLLYKELVIVPATAENHALVALDKHTGSEVWKQEAEGFEGTWGSPILVNLPGGDQEIVLGVPGEIWAFHPDNGKLKWYSKGPGANSNTSSVVAADAVVYALGGRDGDTVAVKAGGKGDVSESNILWSSGERGGIGSPLVHDGLIYWVSRDIATCINVEKGEQVYQKRLEAPTATEQPAEDSGGRRGGGFMNQSYSSLVAADGKLYFMTRAGVCYVLALGPEFKQIAANRFGNDEGDFSASPAISDGELFFRSSKKLYCVSAKD
ncbi:outer membrane protein assembly factor BamB family protein [Bythopirellula polymerisocia]|uniref:Outer membrane biogenesis protein BamB n=1 Tax=Bythopirellula polymerisocia TaxID=2528003 RepID=A0A5C6CFU1_9BACT|nr:PQQ-binding-like beta-propeller repeat protein [Bythopirellula polymerisocia]TWU23803.1 outer membrane biogenesis protein BamB [Bythopirellula polymerisocia]